MIVIALDNAEVKRADEYLPTSYYFFGGGNAENYLDFIEKEVVPNFLTIYKQRIN